MSEKVQNTRSDCYFLIDKMEAAGMMESLEYKIGKHLIQLGIDSAWVITLAISLNLSFTGSSKAEASLLTVENAVWTNEVSDDRQYKDIYTDSAPVGPIFLWMSVRGKEGALKELQEAGKLPIYHKWFRNTLAGATGEGVTDMIDSIPIPAGKQELVKKLQTEIFHRTFFNWRTWSMKENIRRGDWVVKVVYADNTPVKCDGNKDCEYKITIK